MTSAVEAAWCQTTAGSSSSRQRAGHRVVLARDQDGLDVAGADADGLHGDELAVLVAVEDAGEPGANQVTDAVEGLAHASAPWKREWRREPG